VSVEALVLEAGLNDAVAPGGRPLALNDTAELNPFEGVTEIEYVVLSPAVTVRFPGLAESEKSDAGGGGGTAPSARAASIRP
jgi:hypothetical protein